MLYSYCSTTCCLRNTQQIRAVKLGHYITPANVFFVEAIERCANLVFFLWNFCHCRKNQQQKLKSGPIIRLFLKEMPYKTLKTKRKLKAVVTYMKQDNVHTNTESVQCISIVYSMYVHISIISELFRLVEK